MVLAVQAVHVGFEGVVLQPQGFEPGHLGQLPQGVSPQPHPLFVVVAVVCVVQVVVVLPQPPQGIGPPGLSVTGPPSCPLASKPRSGENTI